MYYKSNCTGKIFTENQIKIVNDIYGESKFDDGVNVRIFIPIESPSVIDFIKSGNMSGATYRYRELHNCKLKEAYDAVYAMKRDMYRINKKNGKEDKYDGE